MLTAMEVTIAEAATQLNISPDTIRRRIRKGSISARQAPRPQGYIWMVDVPEISSQNVVVGTGFPQDQDLVSTLKDQVKDLWGQLETRSREISELHRLLAQTALVSSPRQPWWAFWR